MAMRRGSTMKLRMLIKACASETILLLFGTRWVTVPVLLLFLKAGGDGKRQVVHHLGLITACIQISTAQELLLARTQCFTNILLHAGIVEFALPGRLARDQLENVVAVLRPDRRRHLAGQHGKYRLA